MTTWRVLPYTPSDFTDWEVLVERSGNGTMLHTRRFLAYHGTRFVDVSLTVRDERGQLVGIVPAAEDPSDPSTVVSHPGATFGGLLVDPEVTGASYHAMFDDILAHWATLGYARVVYKAVPQIYHSIPRHEDAYVLWRIGAELARCTLSACIDLRSRPELSSRRKRSLQKAARAGCMIEPGVVLLPVLWPVVEEALIARHGVRPVHTLAEIEDLAGRFPKAIDVLAATVEGSVVGAIVLFDALTVSHVQYSVSAPSGMVVSAMDALIERAIERGIERGVRYLDLGISTDSSGRELNEGLHRFKTGFGGGTIVYKQYELQLHRKL